MKTPRDAMVWEDSALEAGFGYHKVATYDAEGGRLKIEVFVAPSTSASCPVRIAVRSSKSSEPQRFALPDPDDADAHLSAIDERLKKIGLSAVLAAYCAGDVVALIKREADSIRATQRELEGRRR